LGWSVTVISAKDTSYSRRTAVRHVAEACRAEGINWISYGAAVWAAENNGAAVPRLARLRSRFRRLTQGVVRRVLFMRWPDIWCFISGVQLLCVRARKPDVILATGMPFGAFVLARLLSHRYRVPYVLDYRDPWSVNPYRETTQRGFLAQQLERWVLARASKTIMVSDSQAIAQHDHFPQYPQPIVITNGFDPEQLRDVEERWSSGCALVYAGILYPGKRDLDPVFAAMARARTLANCPRLPIELHYYGPHSHLVRLAAKKHSVSDFVFCHGLVSRAEALSAIKSAQIAVVVTGMDDQATAAERGIMTGKIFEALGLGTRILLISPRDSDARQLLSDTQCGKAFCASEIDGIANWLVEHGSNPVLKSTPPERCSWATLACTFDQVLRDAII
jgi:glycosyltransferase involved in cell wall biosynthesis